MKPCGFTDADGPGIQMWLSKDDDEWLLEIVDEKGEKFGKWSGGVGKVVTLKGIEQIVNENNDLIYSLDGHGDSVDVDLYAKWFGITYDSELKAAAFSSTRGQEVKDNLLRCLNPKTDEDKQECGETV